MEIKITLKDLEIIHEGLKWMLMWTPAGQLNAEKVIQIRELTLSLHGKIAEYRESSSLSTPDTEKKSSPSVEEMETKARLTGYENVDE